VRQSTNTWQLMVSMPRVHINSKKKRRKGNKTADDDNTNTTGTDGNISSNEKASEPTSPPNTITSKERLKTLIVPKEGSSLTLLIPIPVNKPKTTGSGSVRDEVDNREVDPFILTIDIQEDVKASAD
jgi:hypothetical protein